MQTAPSRSLPEKPRILLIRFSSLGDVVKCTALPRLIKKAYPASHLTFLTSEGHLELLAGNPHIDRVIGFQRKEGVRGVISLAAGLRAEGLDLVVDVHNSLRSRLLRMFLRRPSTRYSKRTLQRLLLIHLGWNTYRPGMDGRVPGKEDDFLAGLAPYGVTDDGLGTELTVKPTLEETQGGDLPSGGLSRELSHAQETVLGWRKAGLPVLGAAPVAAWPLKCWSPEKWREALTGFLRDTGGALLLFGGPGDAHVGQLAEALKKVAPGASRTSTEGDITPRVLSLAGNTTMLQSAWFASQCDLMVSHDTGMSHISEAVGRRVLVLFGPTSRELGYFPVRKDSRTLERPLGCRPCTRTGQGRCRHPWNGACLEGISANTVQSAIMEGLGI